MRDDASRPVVEAVKLAMESAGGPLLLAVSGGLDSMTLLHAACAVDRTRVAAVATFDHGTGPAARAATAHVASEAAAAGLQVVVGRGDSTPAARSTEASWRKDRFRFLRECALPLGARITTAHTRDDHVETVFMRILRGSGARGLAGLTAPSSIVRPFVALSRATLESYVARAGIAWVEDPTNADMAHLRNRVRHELLPALRRGDGQFDAWLLDLADRALAWRMETEAAAATLSATLDPVGRLRVPRAELAGYGPDSLAIVWAVLAARIGLALDRRGTRRIAEFTINGGASGHVPLAGGWTLAAAGDAYVLGRSAGGVAAPVELPELGAAEWGDFTFTAVAGSGKDPWGATLSAPERSVVRAWQPGDRFVSGPTRRRVKRYLSEAGLHGTDREEWPVVVQGEDVVWIPGVRRSDAATDRSGRPVRHYVCERIDR